MSYRLLDSGDGRKLESLAGVIVDRQAPTAIWSPAQSMDAWQKAQGVHHRSDKGGGRWEWNQPCEDQWTVELGVNKMLVKPTPFGHVGLFAEQKEQWQWIEEAVQGFAKSHGRPPVLLNLFAYTGGSTLAAARAGASVTHVDAAKGVVDWGRRNADINGLSEAPIRWIVDDCTVFVEREIRRERFYDGVILDPPTFGRGKKNEVWTIDKNLPPLLNGLKTLVKGDPAIMLLTCHSPGYTPIALTQIAADFFHRGEKKIERGEMSITHSDDDRLLPSGFYTRWSPG